MKTQPSGSSMPFDVSILVVRWIAVSCSLLGMPNMECLNAQTAQSQPIYDEAKIPQYTLPELLIASDGSPITTAEQWAPRRGEIVEQFQHHIFGSMPDAKGKHAVQCDAKLTRDTVTQFTIDPSENPRKTIEGRLREFTLTLSPVKSPLPKSDSASDPVRVEMHLLIISPTKGKGKAPAILGYNFLGNSTVDPSNEISIEHGAWDSKSKRVTKPKEDQRGQRSDRWPVGMMLDRGYALVTLHYGDVDPDFHDEFKNGAHRLFPDLQNRPDNWGAIGAWAWGLHRVLDFLETDEPIDAKRVIVFGHSRLGKTSLWAGATDTRIAGVISNNSGCGGAALSRRRFGESVKRINQVFPHWFCQRHRDYDDNEDACPVDHHMLLAAIAPRPLYIASAEGDRWADPKGEFLSAFHASKAYGLFEKNGLSLESPIMPNVETPIGTDIRYHIRSGKHDVTRYDWQQFLNFADHVIEHQK